MISAPFQGTYQQANSFEYQNQTKSSLDNRLLHQDGKDYPTNYDDQFFDQWLSSQLATDELASQSAHNYLSPAAVMQSNVPPSLHFTGGNGRNAHQRESSLSSLGSMGPASPYTQNTTNPQIAITDSSVENFHNMQNGDMNGQAALAYYPMGKPMEQFNGYQAFDPSIPDMAYPVAVQGPNKPRNDRGLLPAPEVAGMHHRSRPTSVTSSNGGDSPATPNMGEQEQTDNRRRAYGNVPKFDRTMTDVYGDELYSPNFTIISSSPTQSHTTTSPGNHMFTQRLNAANSQHSDYQNQMQRVQSQQQSNDTPKTISPKDAMLDFNESDGNQNFSLFPQGSNANFDFDPLTKMMSNDEDATRQFELLRPSGEQQQAYTQLGMDSRIPQQYPFVPRLSGSDNVVNGRLESAQASPAEHSVAPLRRGRPTSTTADGGTYTCTYHGCSMRFETPSQLQKHKREGHRQMPLGLKSQETTSLGTTTNTQAGPHRCDRINPSTGKPCNSIFSRPYDLTRHEDTIHNARKLKVRCDICTEEKTFSRADALTRHYRVCHPEMELPGKHRRRAT